MDKQKNEIPEDKPKGEIQKLKEGYEKQIAELKEIAQSHKDTLQRLQAEFENTIKRAEREKGEFRRFASAKTIEDFIPIIDSIEEGIKHAQKSGNKEMKQGFETLKKQAIQVLGNNGVEQIETIGKKFDHALHEVLMTEKDETKGDEIITEEFSKGYSVNGKALRPAKVKINKKQEN